MTYNVFSGTLNPTHFTSLQPNCGVEQRAPPIFGRATITLGIGPHSSFGVNFRQLELNGGIKMRVSMVFSCRNKSGCLSPSTPKVTRGEMDCLTPCIFVNVIVKFVLSARL